MKFLLTLPFISLFFLFNATKKSGNSSVPAAVVSDTVHFEGENHFANVRQLTFGGDNAEAYFSFDGKYIIYQRSEPKAGILCDQIWMGKVPESADEPFVPKLVSTGTGRTT